MVDTGLQEQRRNYASNPSFEVDASGWTAIGASGVNRSTTRAWVGTSSGLITLGAGTAVTQGARTDVSGLAVGERYTASVYLFVPAASLAANVALFVNGVVSSTAVATADTWVQRSVSWTATATSHTISVSNTATSTAGMTVGVDGVMVERGNVLGDYFDGATTDTGGTGTLGALIYDWTGAAHGSQSVQYIVVEGFTMTATVEDDRSPQRVRIDVTAASSSVISSVTVTRIDPSGAVVPVRTETGAPLALLVSAGSRVGTVYDYEMPYGQPVTYSTTQEPTVLSDPVTVDESQVWLIHPGIPARSVPIDLMRGSLDEEEEGVEAGVFFPLGRRNAVVITDGRRKAPSGTLIVGTETPADRVALGDLLSDAFPLLLNVPPLTGLDVDTNYIHVGAVRRARPSDIGTDPHRNWLLPFQVVDAPVGGTQSEWTFQSVLDANTTFQSVLDNYPTFADLQAPTT